MSGDDRNDFENLLRFNKKELTTAPRSKMPNFEIGMILLVANTVAYFAHENLFIFGGAIAGCVTFMAFDPCWKNWK